MFGDRLNELLKLKRVTQRELSIRCGVSEACISRYINNVRHPKLNILEKILCALDVDVSLLLSDEPLTDIFNGKTCRICHDLNSPKHVIISTESQSVTILEEDLLEFIHLNKIGG